LTEDESGGRLHLFHRDGNGRRIPACDPSDPESSAGPTAAATPNVVPRDGRRWLRAALLVVVSALLGTLGGRFGAPRLAAETVHVARVAAPRPRDGAIVNAREIIISDAAGIPRMRLGALPDGAPLISMTDGKSTIELGTAAELGAVVRLHGGKSSIELVAPTGEPPSVTASADEGVLVQMPSNVARFLPSDLWPREEEPPPHANAATD
jgi:hypothetical protein